MNKARHASLGPVLRRLLASIDKYDYKLDLEAGILILKMHSSENVRLRPSTSRERQEVQGSNNEGLKNYVSL